MPSDQFIDIYIYMRVKDRYRYRSYALIFHEQTINDWMSFYRLNTALQIAIGQLS